MHHYPHHIGDFRKDTPHLSPSQKGIYRDLLDYAYATEKPLPDDLDMLSRVCGAVKPAERAMVSQVLVQFFTRTKANDGWEHKRVIKEILKFYAKSDAGKLGAASKHYGKPDDEESGKTDGTSGGKEPDKPTSNHKRARNHQPRTKSQEPSTSGAASAFAADEVDPVLLEEPSDPGKKEGGAAGIWLDVGSDPARRLINRALGRIESRAFTSAEMHELGQFAAQQGGQVSVDDMEALAAFLLAAPRFDAATSEWDAVPPDSPLRKRRRTAGRVIEDLPNQIEFARKWLAMAQKKEKGAEIPTPVEDKPPGGWRAAWGELYDFSPPDDWADVPDSNRTDVRLWLNTNTNPEKQ